MSSKVEIFNLAAGALLLNKQFTNADTDKSREATIFRLYYDKAYESTLQDLDLDSTSKRVQLSLITASPYSAFPDVYQWGYSYRYPDDCAFLRRIVSRSIKDHRYSHIAKQVRTINGEKVILTNEQNAVADYIEKDIDPSLLSAEAVMAVAYRLAHRCSPMIVGKGASRKREDVLALYNIAKAEAQEQDALENFMYHDEAVESEFVNARTT